MITLTKDKIIYTNAYNPECEKYIRKEVTCLWEYLEDVVELSSDFTLGDLFHYLEREKHTLDLIFSSSLGHFPLQSYIDDMKKPAVDEGDKLDYLQIQRYGDRWEWGDIDLFVGFSGISESKDIHYAIEFTPLYILKDLPIRLNTEFSVTEMRCPSKIFRFFVRLLKKMRVPLKRWNNPLTHTYVKGTTCFSVYELISTVLSEISFVGDPKMRVKKIAEIVKDIDQLPAT